MLRRRAEVDLVGRDGELGDLLAALARARAGKSGAVVVSGEAGIGKTRLIAEFAAAATREGALVLTGRCVDTRSALPYLPFAEIVQQAVAAGRLPERDGALRLLADGPTPGDDRSPGRVRMFSAVLAAVRHLARETPVVLVAEDLHWADRSSLDLLAFLLSRLGTGPVLTVTSHRSDDLGRGHPLRRVLAELYRLPHVHRLELAPLAQEKTLGLVRALVRATAAAADQAEPPPDTAELEHIARRCDGNPFFAEELVAAGTGAHSGGPTGARSGGLSEVLTARIEHLAEPARSLLRAAAVIGHPAPADTLGALAELDGADLDDALQQALDHGVLAPEPPRNAPPAAVAVERFGFRHALLRESVYDSLLPGRRARLHTRCADLLEKLGGSAAEVAHHALAAHDFPLALDASVRAARDAAHRGAFSEVLAHSERALDLWPSVPDAAAVAGASAVGMTRLAAMGAGDSGEPERALALQRKAVELAEADGDPAVAAATRLRYGLRLLEFPGRAEQAARQAEIALRLLAAAPPSADRAWSHALLARALNRLGRPGEAAEQAASAVRDAVAAGSQAAFAPGTDPYGPECDALGAEADARITLAFAGLRRPGAAEVLAEMRQYGGVSGHFGVELRAHYGLGLARLLAGDPAGAVAEFAAGEERADRTGTTWSEYGLRLRTARAVALFRAGDWTGAAAALRADHPAPGSALIRRQLEAAGTVLAAARGEAVTDLDGRPVAPHLALLAAQARAEAALWRDRPENAADVVRRALDRDRDRGEDSAARRAEELPLYALGATAHGRLGDADAVAALAALARTRAGDAPARGWLAWIDAEHRTALGEATAEQWAGVAAAFAPAEGGCGDHYRRAQALWRRAEVLVRTRTPGADRRAGHALRAQAGADLEQAARIARRLGAAPLLAAVEDLAGRIGVRPSAPTGAAGGPTASGASDTGAGGAGGVADGPLTGRERSVLALVAQGLTNREVGERLFISEKTVSVHLTRVMAKLGAGSRTEAVDAAHRRRLLGLPPDV
ncbi:helix-turn-helix transcriptional regulator [Streptomyces sp. NRRL S-350]|uniref:helix-turn-helix transcriptional regulator n=1 Tax=Streptomyces sp. NRRL S-350 TaxID=1463902 RepID=UPI0004C14A21|nr:AAA family ATPase [Streptomyces sp. NRRL S-350]